MLMGDFSYFEGTMNDKSFSRMMDNRWRMIYPAPFFDPIAMQSVMDPKIMIQWARFFYDWHPIVHAAIQGMTTYPITDFVFDTDDLDAKRSYEDLFNKLNIRNTLQRAGLDYWISGNSFISIILPFTRMLECPECGYSTTVKDARIRSSATKLTILCNKCDQLVEPKVKDLSTKDTKDIHIVHWNPLQMTLDHDDLMNTTDYYYSIPQGIKTSILKGEKKYLMQYPAAFIDAAYKKKMVKLYDSKIMHMRRETHSATYIKGWGQPLISPVLKYLFHLLVLLRAQDALAIDQILPWTILSPSANSGADPASEIDLNSWQSQVRDQYGEWKKNPLHKSVMPIGINAQIVGANGKNLMLNPEIDAITNHILAGMGVPNEFVFGGLSWTGASVSLRMLENKFINHRTMMQRLIDWLVDSISVHYGYPKINVYLQDFKMADDVAQKQLIFDLKAQSLISGQTLLDKLMPDVNYEKEQERIKEEQLKMLKEQQEVQQIQMAQGIIDPMTGMAPQPGQQGQQGSTPNSGANKGDLPEGGAPRAQGGNQQI